MKVYLDYAATTPVDKAVYKAMEPFFGVNFGNTGSLHSFGREAEIAVDNAREEIANFFGVDYLGVFFTSGATEANNWIIYSACSVNSLWNKKSIPHIITTTIEHKSVLEPIKYLEKQGKIEATYIKPNKEGIINPKDVENSLRENTSLITIGYVNNEIGVIQPLKEIGYIVNKHKKIVKELVFHSHVTQAISYLDCDLDKLFVDAISVSAHKIYGPKGIGALITKKNISLKPLFYGGGQEQGLRSGTLNVPGIIGFAKAIQELQITNYKLQIVKIKNLRDKLTNGIIKIYPKIKIVGSIEEKIPNNLSLIFQSIESQIMLIALDQAGIAVSTGSACQAKGVESSYVILALGYSQQDATSFIRFSLGKYTTEKDIEYTLDKLEKIIKKLKSS
ncbi:MAG: cysteine desulfurase family protein [Patescibacteria group bacterium]